jgi:hypothetical protein
MLTREQELERELTRVNEVAETQLEDQAAENERLRAQLARVVDIAEATLTRGDAEYGLGQIIAAAIVLPTRSE